MKHPLLNSDSSHYDGDEPEIYKMERVRTIGYMLDATQFNIDKYKSRLGEKSHIKGILKQVLNLYYIHRPEQYEQFKKDHIEEIRQSDLKKIGTYRDYRTLLKRLEARYGRLMVIRDALDLEGIFFE